MRYLLLVLALFMFAACCIVPLTPNPLTKPPMPLGEPVPRIAPYKWGSV